MLNVSAADIKDSLQWAALTDAVGDMFRSGCEMPARHHHKVKVAGEPDATLLLMPAWTPGGYVGTKILNLFPGNSERGLPSISANYLLASAKTGEMLALIDGGELTAARTAAASALDASYLARPDANLLLIVGTGRLAPLLASAHGSQRPVNTIMVWGRTPDKAAAMARDLTDQGMNAQAADDLETAVGNADIVSCATLAEESLIHGDWLQPGTHVDLVGAYTPEMREADDEVVRRATVFVDTREGATKEAGDIVIPLATGVLSRDGIAADLYDLCRGDHPGRTSDEEITMFKSVGVALEDLAAAILFYENKKNG